MGGKSRGRTSAASDLALARLMSFFGLALPLAESALHKILEKSFVMRVPWVRSEPLHALKVFHELRPPSQSRGILAGFERKSVDNLARTIGCRTTSPDLLTVFVWQLRFCPFFGECFHVVKGVVSDPRRLPPPYTACISASIRHAGTTSCPRRC